MNKKTFKNIAFDGLLRNNPTLRLVLGTCPTLALTTSAINGVGMGLAVTFILICSNALISLLRKVIPDAVRIPSFVLIIATFVTIVRMALAKYIPSLYDAMGVYLPLIVVNCIILGRAEAFASKRPVLDSACDGLFTGLGFAAALTLMGAVREILGAGAIFGVTLWGFKIAFFSSPAGAFFVYGLFIAVFNASYAKISNARYAKNYNKRMLALGDLNNPQTSPLAEEDAMIVSQTESGSIDAERAPDCGGCPMHDACAPNTHDKEDK